MKTTIDSLYDYIDINKHIKEIEKTESIENTETVPAYDCNINTTTNIVSFTQVMNMIMEFYTKSNVNIPITIPDLYELLKAFLLLNGLASQIKYDSLRMSIVIKKILYQYSNIITVIKHPLLASKTYAIYEVESKNYNKLLEKINILQPTKSL
jgi:hypothetical protein